MKNENDLKSRRQTFLILNKYSYTNKIFAWKHETIVLNIEYTKHVWKFTEIENRQNFLYSQFTMYG